MCVRGTLPDAAVGATGEKQVAVERGTGNSVHRSHMGFVRKINGAGEEFVLGGLAGVDIAKNIFWNNDEYFFEKQN